MRDFRQIAVWEKAHQFTLTAYRTVASFPTSERFELSKQITRAACSIGANIAEGCGRGGDGELRQFLKIAVGSAYEVENNLLLARDLGFLKPEQHQPLEEQIKEVQRMLAAFIRKIETDLNRNE
ncbi:MAG TPA: four helix bundle protein [Pirellulales bacterium]|nr:four helix bundle protein [Pirellulales bacterium]